MYFSLFVAAVAMTSYVPSVKMYTSSFLAGETSVVQDQEQQSRLITSTMPVEDYKSHSVVLTLSGNPTMNFAFPGDKNVKALDFSLKSFDADLYLEFVNFKIGGLDPSKVEKIYLMDGENTIAESGVTGGYARFQGLFLNVPAGTEKVIAVKVDLSEDSSTGERLHLTIDKKEDIKLFANGEEYSFGDIFPLEGVYLSVVRSRGR